MQKTRQRILEYLKKHGEATVDELSTELDNLTPVTVRHHLDVLRSEGMVDEPEAIPRSTPGRPRYIYRLTERAVNYFPNNVNLLTHTLLAEVKRNLSGDEVNVLFDGIASSMANAVPPIHEDEPMEARLDHVVVYLNEQGYDARWEPHQQGWLLLTSHCPYGTIPGEHQELCQLDIRYLSQLLGRVPRRMHHMVDGDHTCSYLIEKLAIVS